MGATEMRRSTETLRFSTDSAIFIGFSIYGVSASFLWVYVRLSLASATKMLPESVVAPGGLAIAHILARMRGSGVRYTANIRVNRMLARWLGSEPQVTRVKSNYMPYVLIDFWATPSDA